MAFAFPPPAIIIKAHLFAVPGAAVPHKCPSLTLTPAFTIAVDVMTQNKERGGVRLSFV